VLIRMAATGLCHSDDHMAKGDGVVHHFPYCGGHEGAGVVEIVGPGVRLLRPGDHVVTSFVPRCGRCRWCASGRQNLCDNGALLGTGAQLDGTFRMRYQKQDVARSAFIGAFAEKKRRLGMVLRKNPLSCLAPVCSPPGLCCSNGVGFCRECRQRSPGRRSHRYGGRRHRY
jgi:Zn-dependent alcohol dehydrogenase